MTMFPKNTGYRTTREQKADRYAALRAGTREQVWLRDERRCVWPTCHKLVQLLSADPFQLANIHELGGGRGKVDACDPDRCVTTCATCHSDLHVRVGGITKRIEGDAVSGGLQFFERHGDDWVEVGV